MPIDPSIPLSIRPPAPGPSILDTYQQITQLQEQKLAGEARRAAAQDAHAKRQREAQIEAAFQEAVVLDPVTQQPTVDYAKLLGRNVPAAALFEVKKIIDATGEQAAKLQETNLSVEQKKAVYNAGIARATQAAGYDPDAFKFAIVGAKKIGALSQEETDTLLDAAERDPAAIQRWATGAIARASTAQPETGFTLGPGQVRYGAGGEQIAAGPPKEPDASEHSPIYREWQDYRSTGGTLDFDAYMTQDANRRRTVIHTGAAQRPITQTAEAGLIGRLNGQWTTATKGPRELSQQLTTMRLGLQAAERGDMAQGTEAVLQPFLKILDPNSVVREGEFFRLREGQSYISRARGIMQRLTQGGFVPLSELKKYAALAEEIAKRQDSYVAGVRGRIGKVAERYNIPEELVFEGSAPILDTSTTPAGGGGAAGLSYQDYQRAKGK